MFCKSEFNLNNIYIKEYYMRKRILVCAAYFYPHKGGYENYINELYSRLNSKFDVDILVSDFQGNPEFEKLGNMDIYRIDSFGLLGNMYTLPKINLRNIKILRKILNTKYDFINTHTRFFSISLLGFILSKLSSTKLIHTEHGVGPVVFNNRLVSLISNIYDKTLGKLIIKSADINIGISNASCKFLKNMGGNNIYLVQNGVDTEIFKKNGSNLKEILKISGNYKIITFTGRIIYAKGIQDLINCFFDIQKMGYEVKLLIVGDGSYKNNLEKLADKNKDILFLGLRDDIVDILNITDILVNPSYSEGLPTSILEAASLGIPVIATDVGGTKEMFIDEMGFLIKENDKQILLDAVINLLESDNDNVNREIRIKHIKNNYDWEKIVNIYLKIIKGYNTC